MVKLETSAYAAVRRTSDSGKEWMDLATVEVLPQLAMTAAAREDHKCGPMWVKDNPVVRYVALTITEDFSL